MVRAPKVDRVQPAQSVIPMRPNRTPRTGPASTVANCTRCLDGSCQCAESWALPVTATARPRTSKRGRKFSIWGDVTNRTDPVSEQF
jgi:hypothetical protein